MDVYSNSKQTYKRGRNEAAAQPVAVDQSSESDAELSRPASGLERVQLFKHFNIRCVNSQETRAIKHEQKQWPQTPKGFSSYQGIEQVSDSAVSKSRDSSGILENSNDPMPKTSTQPPQHTKFS